MGNKSNLQQGVESENFELQTFINGTSSTREEEFQPKNAEKINKFPKNVKPFTRFNCRYKTLLGIVGSLIALILISAILGVTMQGENEFIFEHRLNLNLRP